MQDLTVHFIPFFAATLIIELAFSFYLKKKKYTTKDTLGSLSMGIGSVFVNMGAKTISFGLYTIIYQYRIFELENVWWMWVILLFADDFTYYIFHRTSHSIRFFWASHVIHHSSTHYNLSTALRQTWTGNLTGGFIFWLWLPLVGFHPAWIILMQGISLVYQYWIHTEFIGRLPRFLEFILNTPSHHRVHHGSDTEYLDRNHAGIFIVWDRMFGTFVNETFRPTYGLTQNINTYNPVKIAFIEWKTIAKDIAGSPSVGAAFMYVFGPPGWSHDGSRKTSKQMREELIKLEK